MERLREESIVENIGGVSSNVIHYISTCRKTFNDNYAIEISRENDENLLRRLIAYLFSVSYDSTLEEGWHLRGRIDGNHGDRFLGEIFADKLLGCMGEIALYKYIKDKIDDEVNEPNLTDRGGYENPDRRDLYWHNKNFSIKTTRSTHNLLLLQKEHYRDDSGYKPNIRRGREPVYFDYHVLCRVKAVNEDLEDVLSSVRFEKDTITEEERQFLENAVINTKWFVDIPGFISNEQFIEDVIRQNRLVLASNNNQKYCFGSKDFNEVNKVDVDNYYVQAGDLNPINEIKEITRTEGRVKYSNPNDHYAYLIDDEETEYKVSSYTFERTDSSQRVFDISQQLRLSFTVVKKNDKKYANDIRELVLQNNE